MLISASSHAWYFVFIVGLKDGEEETFTKPWFGTFNMLFARVSQPATKSFVWKLIWKQRIRIKQQLIANNSNHNNSKDTEKQTTDN